ncbi:hypothetical protein BDC45DRAFT_562241, partial [Circinella umbellata]
MNRYNVLRLLQQQQPQQPRQPQQFQRQVPNFAGHPLEDALNEILQQHHDVLVFAPPRSDKSRILEAALYHELNLNRQTSKYLVLYPDMHMCQIKLQMLQQRFPQLNSIALAEGVNDQQIADADAIVSIPSMWYPRRVVNVNLIVVVEILEIMGDPQERDYLDAYLAHVKRNNHSHRHRIVATSSE